MARLYRSRNYIPANYEPAAVAEQSWVGRPRIAGQVPLQLFEEELTALVPRMQQIGETNYPPIRLQREVIDGVPAQVVPSFNPRQRLLTDADYVRVPYMMERGYAPAMLVKPRFDSIGGLSDKWYPPDRRFIQTRYEQELADPLTGYEVNPREVEIQFAPTAYMQVPFSRETGMALGYAEAEPIRWHNHPSIPY